MYPIKGYPKSGYSKQENRQKAVFFCAKRGDCGLLARRFPLAAAPWGLAR